jgi:hypothetical protein
VSSRSSNRATKVCLRPEEDKEEKMEDKEEKMEYQDAKRTLKAVYDHSNSSTDEHHKVLHVMFGGSWDITSRRVIKTLC